MTDWVKPVEEAVLKRVAAIMGERSAAAEALAHASSLRSEGKEVAFFEAISKGQHYTVVQLIYATRREVKPDLR